MSSDHPAGLLGLDDVVRAKRGATVSVCIPARNEAATVGAIVGAIRRRLVDEVALVDQILVIDDGSTAEVARSVDLLPTMGARSGKGEAMWKSLAGSTGDVVVWIDADLEGFDPSWVTRLASPLLLDADVAFVKGHYTRLSEPQTSGGGRVTELVARPAIAMFHPQLSGIVQPLGGEYAGRRSVLEEVPFAGGYGVDLGLLIDISRQEGAEAIAQVDLGERRHRNRPLSELSVQAAEVLHVALRRAGVSTEAVPALTTPVGTTTYETRDRPPLASVTELARLDPTA